MVDYSTPLQVKGPDPEGPLKALGAATELQKGAAQARLFGQQADLQQMRINALKTGDLNEVVKVDPALAHQMIEVQKNQLDLGQQKRSIDATRSYSDAKQGGNQLDIATAHNRLAEFPEVYKTITDAEAAGDENTRKQVLYHADIFGRQAMAAYSAPAGSKERNVAWNDFVDMAFKEGKIDAAARDAQYDHPNELRLRQTIQRSMAVKDYMEEFGQAAGNRARAELPSKLTEVGATGAQARQTEQFGAQFRTVTVPVTGADGVVREVTVPASQLPSMTGAGPAAAGGAGGGPAAAPNGLAAGGNAAPAAPAPSALTPAGGPAPVAARPNALAPAAAPAPNQLQVANGVPVPAAAPRAPVATAPLTAPTSVAVPTVGGSTPPGKPVYNKEQDAILDARGKAFQEGMDERKTAVDAKGKLATISAALDRFQSGPTAEIKRDAAAGLIDVMKSVGMKPSADMEKSVAANDLMTKEGTRLGFDLARQLGGREPGFIVQQAVSVNPNIKLTDLSNRQIVGILGADLQRKIDMQDSREEWISKNGSQAGFDRWFNDSHPAEAYVSRAVPAPLPKTPDSKAMKNGWTYDTPRGPAVWNGAKQVFEPAPAQ